MSIKIVLWLGLVMLLLEEGSCQLRRFNVTETRTFYFESDNGNLKALKYSDTTAQMSNRCMQYEGTYIKFTIPQQEGNYTYDLKHLEMCFHVEYVWNQAEEKEVYITKNLNTSKYTFPSSSGAEVTPQMLPADFFKDGFTTKFYANIQKSDLHKNVYCLKSNEFSKFTDDQVMKEGETIEIALMFADPTNLTSLSSCAVQQAQALFLQFCDLANTCESFPPQMTFISPNERSFIFWAVVIGIEIIAMGLISWIIQRQRIGILLPKIDNKILGRLRRQTSFDD